MNLLKHCSAAHTTQTLPGSNVTIGELRQQFAINSATLRGLSLRMLRKRVEGMRRIVRRMPDEFIDETEEQLDRLLARAVVIRMEGEV